MHTTQVYIYIKRWWQAVISAIAIRFTYPDSAYLLEHKKPSQMHYMTKMQCSSSKYHASSAGLSPTRNEWEFHNYLAAAFDYTNKSWLSSGSQNYRKVLSHLTKESQVCQAVLRWKKNSNIVDRAEPNWDPLLLFFILADRSGSYLLSWPIKWVTADRIIEKS